MIDEVAELFGASGDAAQPRVGTFAILCVLGLTLLGVGMLLTVLPGVMLLLAARAVVETESARLRNGFLAESDARTIRRMRWLSTTALLFAVAAMSLQAWLVSDGVYENLIHALLDAAGLLHGLP